MVLQTERFELFADYFQFYLQDEPVEGNLGELWDKDAVDRLLATTDGTIGVGTVRNMTVAVIVEIHDAPPSEDFDQWDQVNECSINIQSGRIVIAGCTDYFPDAARIAADPGCYRARILYGNLNSLSDDGLDGDDRYKIILWQAPHADLVVLKQRELTEANRN